MNIQAPGTLPTHFTVCLINTLCTRGREITRVELEEQQGHLSISCWRAAEKPPLEQQQHFPINSELWFWVYQQTDYCEDVDFYTYIYTSLHTYPSSRKPPAITSTDH